ncbi:hypothetical protein DL770_005219 [Monosporascus sp. CRB-9-2]|nr:hypothetical protein DL770_005219 [Monosporascus sp. CRB-9-2]
MTPSLVKAKPEPREQVAPPATNSAPPVRPAITASTTPSLPASPAPTTPTPQPTSPDLTTSELQGRLWNEAYDDLKKKESKLVDAYERLLSRELSEGDSSSMDETPQENEIEQTNLKTRRTQMVRLVQAGLKKIEKEAAVKHDIQEKMHTVSSVKELIDTAVKSVPEAAIAWTGACFILQMLANPISEAGANHDGIAYVISRMGWYWNLSSLLLEENQVDKTAALRGELEKHIMDLYKKLLLYQMKSVCSYYRNRLLVVLRDMVKLDDWENTLQSIKVAENTIRQDSDQYSAQEIKSRLGELVRTAESLAANLLPGIREALQDQAAQLREMQDEKENKKCLADLRATDPRGDKKRIEDTKGGLFRDSSNWILGHEDFQRWRDDDEARLLWIKGDPGKGKTMLLIAIINELERQLKELKQSHQQSAIDTTALSYFFCQGTNSNLNNATAVLRGLVYLLGAQNPQLASHLRKSYDTARSKLFEDANAFFSLSEVLEGMLRDAAVTRIYILVDALDECETDLQRLLKFIVHNTSASPHVKWIVSSRNRREIEEPLELSEHKVRLHLELNREAISAAVDKYIRYKVSQLALQKKYDSETQDAVRVHLCANANDTFLWVSLVCENLRKIDPWKTSSRLKEFPPGLESLYERMIKQICASEDVELYKRVLAVATNVYQPLTLTELASLVELPQVISDNLEWLEQFIGQCGSFLTIRGGMIYFVHQSVKDYLSDKASSTIFPSGPTDVHHAIFSRSLQAMSTLRRNIYNLHRPGLLIGEINAPDPDPLAAIRYSCVHWIGHFCDAYSSSRPEVETVGQFLREKSLYWLEALGLIQHMGDVILSITRLESLLMGHSDSVRSVAFSHNSKLLASGSRDNTIKIWDAATGSLQQTLEGHSGWVESVAFSHDSKLLASGSDDKTIKIWDAATGSLQQTLGLGTTVQIMSFADTGLYLDTEIGRIDLAAGTKRIQSLLRTPHPDQAQEADYYGYALSRDRSWITWNKQNVLWLPTYYRPYTSAISSFVLPSAPSTITRIGLGCGSGRVVMIGLSSSGPL